MEIIASLKRPLALETKSETYPVVLSVSMDFLFSEKIAANPAES
jgi:hypothetical protein